MGKAHYPKWITLGSLAGLGAGLALGLLVQRTGNPWLHRFLLSLEPVATIWLNALSLIVFPLIVSVLFVSIASRAASEKPAKLGLLTLACYVSILCLGAIFSFLAASILVGGFSVDPRALASLRASVAPIPAGTTSATPSPWHWVRSLASSHLPGIAAAGFILSLLAATILLAATARRLDARNQARFVRFFETVGNVTMVVIRWLFYALPLVVFVLVASLYSSTGSLIARGIGYYILAVCGTFLGFTALQYLIAWLAGGISVLRFARSLWAAQATAVTTRSSLASLPPLLDGALNRLGLPRTVAAFVLPLSVSTFKASQSIYPLFKLIFLAHLFGVPLRPASQVAFVIGVFILSFTVAGIPSGGSLQTIPLLLAMGIPIQGLVLFDSVEAIPDIFETLLNVTADMTVAAVVARFLAGRDTLAPHKVLETSAGSGK